MQGVQQIDQGCAGPANVQITGRTRRKSNANTHGLDFSFKNCFGKIGAAAGQWQEKVWFAVWPAKSRTKPKGIQESDSCRHFSFVRVPWQRLGLFRDDFKA